MKEKERDGRERDNEGGTEERERTLKQYSNNVKHSVM